MRRYETDFIVPGGEGNAMLCDADTERKVLGELASISPKQARSAIDNLTIDSFYVTLHRRIYSYICEIVARGERADLMAVRNEWLKEVAKSEDVPILDLTDTLEDGYLSYVELKGGINILVELEKRRKIWVLGQRLINSGLNRRDDIDDVMEDTRKFLAEINGRGSGDIVSMTNVLQDISGIVQDNLSGKSSERVTPSGVDEFDRLGGLQQGNLVVIAAESSQGKTSFANTICHNVVRKGHKVAFYSLEMTKEELTARLLASVTGVKANKILSSALDASEVSYLQHGFDVMTKYSHNLFFEDKSTNTIDSILNSIRRMYYRYGIKGAVIDYLQLISGRNKLANKTAFIGEVTRELKNIAKELGIWIILLSQLNRNKEGGNPFPNMDRLRDSGEILEACDVCLLIYRPEYYNKMLGKSLGYGKPYADVSTEDTALIIQAKGRNTGTGKWIMGFDPERTVFVNIDQGDLPRAGVTGSDIKEAASIRMPYSDTDDMEAIESAIRRQDLPF